MNIHIRTVYQSTYTYGYIWVLCTYMYVCMYIYIRTGISLCTNTYPRTCNFIVHICVGLSEDRVTQTPTVYHNVFMNIAMVGGLHVRINSHESTDIQSLIFVIPEKMPNCVSKMVLRWCVLCPLILSGFPRYFRHLCGGSCRIKGTFFPLALTVPFPLLPLPGWSANKMFNHNQNVGEYPSNVGITRINTKMMLTGREKEEEEEEEEW